MAKPPFRCIFCKSASGSFDSCEHIVPESLGNLEHILPPGIVCDKCNNYFSRKIEGPLLSTEFFRQARHRNGIPNKRKRIPVQGMLSSLMPYPWNWALTGTGRATCQLHTTRTMTDSSIVCWHPTVSRLSFHAQQTHQTDCSLGFY